MHLQDKASVRGKVGNRGDDRSGARTRTTAGYIWGLGTRASAGLSGMWAGRLWVVGFCALGVSVWESERLEFGEGTAGRREVCDQATAPPSRFIPEAAGGQYRSNVSSADLLNHRWFINIPFAVVDPLSLLETNVSHR